MSKVKETALRILSLLPGVDCGGFGGCGYPTCEACAQAIAEGKSAALCPACDSDAVRSISEELGREPVEGMLPARKDSMEWSLARRRKSVDSWMVNASGDAWVSEVVSNAVNLMRCTWKTISL